MISVILRTNVKKLLIIFFPLFLVSCASAPQKELEPVVKPSVATPLFVPEQSGDRGFFSSLDSGVIKDMEIGSPSSIKRAASKIRNPSTQQEKIILAVASSLMTIVWPSEPNNIQVPPDIEINAYTAAIDSAKMGIYDVNTGNSDFFTIVLPSLVLLTSQTQNDYYSLSESSLNSALKIRADSVLVHYLLGCLYKRMGNLESAYNYFKKARDLDKACLETGYAFAEINYLQQKYSEALATTEELQKSHPGNIKVLKLLSQVSTKMGAFVVAENYINQVLQREPDNREFTLLKIEVLMNKGDYVKAVSLLDVYSRVDKTSKDYLLLRSRIQYEWNKNTAAAASTAEQALELYPNDPEVVLSAAHLATMTGNRVQGKTAGQLAQEILSQDPSNTDAIFILAEDAIVHRDWQTAYENTSRLMKSSNLSLDRRLLHVEACIGAGYVNEAQQEIKPLYDEYKNSDEVKELYIRTLGVMGNTNEVRSLISELLPTASSQLKSFLYYQKSLLASNDTDKLSDLRQSLTANPRNDESLFELYSYYFNRRDYRKAQYYLKQVVALNANDEYILNLNAELESLLQ